MKPVDLNSGRSSLARYFLGFLAPAPKPVLAAPEILGLPKRGTILLVDDDEVILQTTSSKLKSAGYDVITARDCSAAINAVAQRRPDVIMLDINFPPDVAAGGMTAWDGFQLMYWMRALENTKGARFFIISGSDSEDLKKRARTHGAAAFFQKPIDHNRLLEALGCGFDPLAREPGEANRLKSWN